MTTFIDDPQDGDLVAMIYRHDDATGWLAEVQKRFGGAGSFSLYEHLQLPTTTKWGAKWAARKLLRQAEKIERAKLSRDNPIIVARVRAD